MNDWFEWNGVPCTNYGIHVLSQPTIIKPAERAERVQIPGRSGTLTRLEGPNVYDDINLSCTCVIDDQYIVEDNVRQDLIARICGWLKGSGTVSFPIREGGFYKARISNQISFDKVVQGNPHRVFSVQFICEPFFYLTSGNSTITMNENPYRLSNPGNIPSEPLIRITGTGEGTIMLGRSTMLLNDISDLSYIMLDCAAQIAYKGANGDPNDPLVLLGTRVTGEWLTIPVGDSLLETGDNITSVTIMPRWRCI